MHVILPQDKNPALRGKAHALTIEEITGSKTQKLIADMRDLLAAEEYGVALAAPQVGEPIQLFIVSADAVSKRSKKYADEDGKGSPISGDVYINPSITKMSRKKIGKHEGCLSVRGYWGVVKRAEKVTLSYRDEHGKKHERGATGFLAHIFQHEVDHLNGVLYTDKAEEMYIDEKHE